MRSENWPLNGKGSELSFPPLDLTGQPPTQLSRYYLLRGTILSYFQNPED